MYKYQTQVHNFIANGEAIETVAEIMLANNSKYDVVTTHNTTDNTTDNTTHNTTDNKQSNSKLKNKLMKAKREYDASLASTVRFIAELATGTLDHDGEDINRTLAAKLYIHYNIADNNDKNGRKIIMAQLRKQAPYITDNGIIARRCKVNKKVREAAGYVGANCLYCYKPATFMKALIDAYYNRNNDNQRNVVLLVSPNDKTPLSGTLERGSESKYSPLSVHDLAKLERIWMEIKK